MKTQWFRSLPGGNRGFALMIAVAVLTILVFSGVTLQRGVFDEVWEARLSASRTRARLVILAGLEDALSQLQGFLSREELQQTIMGKVRESAYQVTMRKTTAGRVGAALNWMASDKLLVEITIAAVQPTAGGVRIPGKKLPPETIQRVTAIVDPEKVPYRIVLWMRE